MSIMMPSGGLEPRNVSRL